MAAANGGENYARGPVSRVLSTGRSRMGDHSSRTTLARRLKQPTRTTGASHPICRPYSVLLQVGFAVPPPLPEARCALTAPFRPNSEPCGPTERSAFCCTVPKAQVTPAPRRALPGTFTLRSPDFPPVHRCTGGRPALWRGPPSRPKRLSQPRPFRASAPLSPPVSSDSSMARHSPSMIPSTLVGRKRRWKARTAALASTT